MPWIKNLAHIDNVGVLAFSCTTPNDPIVLWAIAACARGHRSDGPKVNHALTFKLDRSNGGRVGLSAENPFKDFALLFSANDIRLLG